MFFYVFMFFNIDYSIDYSIIDCVSVIYFRQIALNFDNTYILCCSLGLPLGSMFFTF